MCSKYTKNTKFDCKSCHVNAVEVKEILKKFKKLDTEEDKINEFKKLQDKNSDL